MGSENFTGSRTAGKTDRKKFARRRCHNVTPPGPPVGRTRPVASSAVPPKIYGTIKALPLGVAGAVVRVGDLNSDFFL